MERGLPFLWVCQRAVERKDGAVEAAVVGRSSLPSHILPIPQTNDHRPAKPLSQPRASWRQYAPAGSARSVSQGMWTLPTQAAATCCARAALPAWTSAPCAGGAPHSYGCTSSAVRWAVQVAVQAVLGEGGAVFAGVQVARSSRGCRVYVSLEMFLRKEVCGRVVWNIGRTSGRCDLAWPSEGVEGVTQLFMWSMSKAMRRLCTLCAPWLCL